MEKRKLVDAKLKKKATEAGPAEKGDGKTRKKKATGRVRSTKGE